MNDTPETDAFFWRKNIDWDKEVEFCRKIERERDEAREYADKLAEGLPEGMLPKDVEVLREANLGLATNIAAVTEQRDRLAEAIYKTIMENLHLADGDDCTLKRLKDVIQFELPNE
jgi:hypothetical protein